MNEMKRFISRTNKHVDKNDASRLFRFASKIKQGDYVLVPSKQQHNMYHVGIICGSCLYCEQSKLNYQRQVEWLHSTLNKNQFDDRTKNSMGSLLSLFSLQMPVSELIGIIGGESI